ncbi:transcription factor bHLH112 [Phragmites australis]|uniref:transcription factor bHLH112 n=1 Tax=Phragmites australis TaxID=29695 RepID=UPI002D77ECC0|nr:transcription factor bHLH112 [Phragmites australis]
MGDHAAEMLHAAPAMYNGGGGAASHGSWWNTAVPAATCSTELAAFSTWSSALAASYDMAEGGKAKSTTTASSESPGNNSSVTFQEPTNIADPAGVGSAVPQQALAGYTEWTHPYMSSGATLHGFLQDGHHDMSSRTDQSHMTTSSLMNPSSNNLTLQGHQEQDHHQQLLSNLGSELLLSPTSPYEFQSSLLRSLMEPMATAAKPVLPGFQQYDQYQQMGQVPQAAARFAPAGFTEPLQFTNDTPFWNPSAAGFGVPAAAPDQASIRSVKPSPAPRAATLALKTALEGVGESSSIITKKESGEPAFKKPRLATPSPLPTFKVRKEKLGDRITALQQLVAPFGKTDTASVLHETIEYIKFLHDQVSVLSAPYLKNNGHRVPPLKSSSTDKSKDSHGEISLKGRGLCLVPISSTFAVASEVPVDFWTPFGANFR